MTRICTLCKQIMDEKCARCGTEATPLKANSYGQPVTGTEFDCPSCNHHFPQGDGGETGAPCASRASMPLCRGRTSRRRRVHVLNRQQKSTMTGGTNAYHEEQ